MDEEEIKIKMDDSVNTSLTFKGIYLFVDMWEAQPCLQEPKSYSSELNYLVRDV